MKKNVIKSLSLLSLTVLLLASCGKLPQAEIDSANLALEDAKTAQADIYVPADYAVVNDSLKAALELVETEKSNVFKNFDLAKAKLQQVVTLANDTKQKVEVRKAELKVEIDTLLVSVKNTIDIDNLLVAKAPKGKEGKSALDEIKAEITTVASWVEQADSLYQQGNLVPAVDKLNAAKQKALGLKTELETVLEKCKRK